MKPLVADGSHRKGDVAMRCIDRALLSAERTGAPSNGNITTQRPVEHIGDIPAMAAAVKFPHTVLPVVERYAEPIGWRKDYQRKNRLSAECPLPQSWSGSSGAWAEILSVISARPLLIR